jgi:DNA-binding LytR/AlgR family response regulator
MNSNYTTFIQENYFKVIQKHDFIFDEKRICLPVDYKNQLNIYTKDIIQLEAHSNYTLFYFANGNTLMVSKTMKEYLIYLDDYFVRIHKKFVINLRYLTQFDLNKGMCVLLKDGKKRTISRRRKREFIEKTINVFGQMEVF